MSKLIAIAVGIAIVGCISGCGDPASVANSRILDYAEVKAFKSQDEIKSQYPVADWLEFQNDDTKFLFCTYDLPAYGNSNIRVRGWVFKKPSRQWEEVLALKMTGVGKMVLAADPKTNLLSARGAANNSYLGKELFSINITTLE